MWSKVKFPALGWITKEITKEEKGSIQDAPPLTTGLCAERPTVN
jgi:hypothetical protein